ncbi:RNA methyltransferase, TrmH family [Ancylostoma ceylanicum]|uniref:RNA methyltransferase, TrmH family n=1 Tax=Ancylostoma ceylanicum TaxID=53326 RepID=A0A0D6LF22_9BILA|nr:RNA methyltransferase, TrmH family [Ancylostoma ceylanicum]
MDDPSSSENGHCRSYFIELVDKAQSNDDIADLITLFETLNGEELENALPSLCFLAEKCPSCLRENMLDLAHCILTDPNCSRSGRKAVLACLRVLTHGEESSWDSFFTLYQCLEEPQFHIINPVLPRMDDVLAAVHGGLLSFKWAAALFMRALLHSNGWVRLWSIEKLVSVDPAIMASNQDATECVNEVGCLTSFFSRSFPKLFDQFIEMDPIRELLAAQDEPVDFIQLALLNRRDFEKDDFASLLWVRAVLLGEEIQLQKRLELELADRLTAVEDGIDVGLSPDVVEAVDILLCILFASPRDLISLDSGLVQLINGYVLLRIAVASETEAIPCDRHCLLARVLYDLLDELSEEDVAEILPKIISYLGEKPLAPIRLYRKSMCSRENDTNKQASKLHEFRLKLVLKFLCHLREGPESLLTECVECIDSASAYPVAECYLKISRTLIEKSFCEELLELARLNTPVALHLSTELKNAAQADSLTSDWATIIVSLAVFGPIPKKENRVINAAYDIIYTRLPNNYDDMHKPFEVVQRTRLNGICTALLLSQKDLKFANDLVDEAIPCDRHCLLARVLYDLLDELSEEDVAEILPKIISYLGEKPLAPIRLYRKSMCSRENDTNKQASKLHEFRLKLAVLDNVFANSVNWIVDPCQQFSIKLILEWLIVRMALRHPLVKAKLLGQERIFANRRIGSVSSWINMIVLMSRAEEDKSSIMQFIELILPWTTAQNFAVRCTAIAGLRLMYKALNSEQKECWYLLQRIIDFNSEPTGNAQRIIDNLVADFYFGQLHPINHFDMQTVFVVLPSKTGMPPEELLVDDLLQAIYASLVVGLSKSSSCAPEINDNETDDAYSEDKGLCRTCEIFGVDTLVIADPIYAADPGFKALSMSAEKKQKIEAVRPDGLLNYLAEMRKKGYTVVAAEQTTDSVALHKFSFPQKTVLLLGDEKEGVPVQLLRYVDHTVEIEQLGQTRSLNVHVSAALFIAKYVEQTVTIFWIMIWVYASITAITTGYLWSLEWLGGPQSNRAAVSHDITDERYVDPNETNPETKKAIKYGSIILVASIVVFVLKVVAWSIARRVFKELRKERIEAMEETARENIYELGELPHSGEYTNEKKAAFIPVMQELSPILPTKPSRLSPTPRESYI